MRTNLKLFSIKQSLLTSIDLKVTSAHDNFISTSMKKANLFKFLGLLIAMIFVSFLGYSQKVMVIYAPDNTTGNVRISGLVNRLTALNVFSQVTGQEINGPNQVTLAQLNQYDAVMVMTDGGYSASWGLDATLRDYVNAGGGVAVFMFANASIPLGSNWPYAVLSPAGQSFAGTSISQVDLPNHPTLKYPFVINTSTWNIGSTYSSTATTLTSGSYSIFKFTGPRPGLQAKEGVGTSGNGRVIDFAIWPDFNNNLEGDRLIANVLIWLMGQINVVENGNCITSNQFTFSFVDNISTNPVVSYSWNFGDNTTSTLSNPVKSYTAAGVYNVTVTVTRQDNTTQSFGTVVTVYALPTVANAGNDVTVATGTTSTTLTGNVPTAGTAAWSKVTGPGTQTITNSGATGSVSSLQTGSYVFNYTISNGGCPSSTDQMTLNVGTPSNANPTITTPSNVSSLCSGATTSAVSFTVADAETAAGSLVVSATSSNQTLIPNANLTVTQPNSSGVAQITATAASGQTGTATITLTVTDGGAATATTTFTVTVNAAESVTIGNSLCSSNTLQWMSLNSITPTTATGSGQNGIGVTITQSGGGMQQTSGMYQPGDFPGQYNIPGAGVPTIANYNAGNFQACFSQPVTNPVVAFSSIGNPSTPVTVTVSQPYSIVWSGTGTTWTSNTQFTGAEGDNIIRIDGTVTCVNFNYAQAETYCNIAFGFENQNCFGPTICAGQSVTLTASGASAYSWTPTTGLSATNTASVVASPTTTTTYTVTNPNNSCTQPVSVTVTVNPVPNVTAVTSQSVCAGSATTAINFAGSVSGATYAWTNSNTAIGLAASGTGNIASFTATNTTASNIAGTITVTPSAGGCTGTAATATIGVKAVPTVVVPGNQVYAAGSTVPAQTFTGNISNAVYNWTNNNTATGIPALGNGNINSFTATNNTAAPITSTITVTPTNQFTYTVYRTHNGNGNTSQYPDYVLNAAGFDNMLNLANSNTTVWSNGTSSNLTTLLNWTGYTTLNAAGISTPGGDYFAIKTQGTFTAAESGVYTFELQGDDAVDLFLDGNPAVTHYGGHGMTSNTGTITLVAGQTYSLVTRHQEYGGGEGFILRWKRPSQSSFSMQADELAGCSGTAQTFTITVDPTPNVNDPANVTACEGTAVTVDFTGTTSNTNYNWTNDNTSIGLAASGTNDITFTPTNATNVAQTANLTVTPQAYVTQGYVWGQVSENGTLTLNAPAGKVFTTVDFASYGVPTGTIGNWSIGSCHATTSNSVVSAASIGQSTMSIVANNATFGNPCGTTAKTLAVKLGYGVSVTGTAQTFTITVNPNAQIANSSQTICTGTAFTFAPANSDVVPANTSYTWTVAANNNVTGETAQSTASASFSQTLTNTTLLNQNVVYTVTPVSGTGSCVGASFTNTVTVTPLPTSITAAGSTTFCQGGSVSLLAPVAPLNMSYTYQWNLNGTAITGATSSTYIANAAGSYTVTITNNNGCTATSSAVVVTVNALPTVNAITGTSTLCVGATSALASTTTGGTWSTSNNAIATVNASGVVNAISAGTATITYSVTNSNGCTNTATQVVTINALPTVAAITGANSVCAGSTIQLESATANGVWSSGNTAVATIGTNGVVTGVSAGVSTISYTVTNSNGCVTSVTADVNVNAVPNSAVVPSGATTFCQGGSVVLTASAGTSYQWSNGAQTQAITVTSGGSYYVNVTNAAGCSVISASQVVTVNPLPTVAAIAGSNNVCVGSTVNLTNATTGGVWSSSNTAVATISSLGIVTGVTSGTSTITYTVTSTAGCTSTASFLLNVNALPTISSITGLNSVCLGSTVTLSNGTSNGTWSSSNVGIATIAANGVVTGVGVGNAIITYTITNSFGCVNSISTNMTVNALPTPVINPNGPLSFCQGGTVTLTATGGVSYLWSTGATTNSIIADTSGDYSVTVTNPNGCIATTSPTSVVVWDLPIAAISSTGSSICLGSTATLTATGGVNYAWSNGSNNANTTVNSSNTYTVTVTDINGCTNTASEQVTVNPIPVPVISANGPVTFCSGSSVTLNASGANSFVWSDGTLGSTLNVTQSGTYYVQGTSNAGCTGTSNVIQIVVNPSPVVAAITGANSLCEGTAITLSTATNGGVWSTSNSFIATVNNNGVVTGINAGTTVISYTVSNGSCNTTVSALVTVLNTPATPTITAGGPTSVCPGETVNLFASNAPNYQWNSGQLTNNILVTLSGSYTVSVIGSNGCTATSLPVVVSISDNINPTITAPLNVNVSPNLGCEAIGVALGTPITSDNCSVASVTNDAPAIYPIGTTTVTWTVTDASGNSATAIQLVNVVDQTAPQAQAQLDVIVSTTQNCEATNVVLAEPIATDNCTENLTIVNNAPAVFPIGTTVVTWTITDAAGNFTTVNQNVIVEDKTAPNVILQNTAILLNTDGSATLSFEQVDNGSYDNCTISDIVLSQAQFDCSNVGNNVITVTITDANGNSSSAEVTVLVIASEACGEDQWNGPDVPEAFTPNGNSINDTWVIPGLEGYNTKQLAVYSRYGTMVYYSGEYQNDWDGTLMGNGVPVPDATYYYTLKLDGGKQMSGYVYINRVKQ
jgi:gliding motility-associated-like protein